MGACILPINIDHTNFGEYHNHDPIILYIYGNRFFCYTYNNYFIYVVSFQASRDEDESTIPAIF